ncbi:MAG: hypothetical protein J4N95_02310 [Chloroflexi bacterium]|nr:hypothetical protein [Chloroflexota bacterium]MCI0855421.1 hypothetical protein [Chloroflexota bacterium]
MSDAHVRRRRRRRKGRSPDEGPVYQQQAPKTPSKAQPRFMPEWNWRTFPVFFAFVAGIVIMGLVADTILGLIFFGGLFGLAYGVAHILSRMWVTRRRG